jgi:hypothetical protein
LASAHNWHWNYARAAIEVSDFAIAGPFTTRGILAQSLYNPDDWLSNMGQSNLGFGSVYYYDLLVGLWTWSSFFSFAGFPHFPYGFGVTDALVPF